MTLPYSLLSKTIATNPEAEVLKGLAHVELRDAGEVNGRTQEARAYVTLLENSTIVNKENVDEVLRGALATEDKQGRSRDPVATIRIFHEGKILGMPQLYADRETYKVFDQQKGEHVERLRKAPTDVTVANLLKGKEGFSQRDTENRAILSAVIAGLKGEPAPALSHLLEEKVDPSQRSWANGLVESAKEYHKGASMGALQIEVISGERLPFGGKSAEQYLADKNLNHLAAYQLREPAKNSDAVRITPVYMETVVALQRNEEGQGFAVFASPVAMWRKDFNPVKLSDIKIQALPEMESAKKVTAEKRSDDHDNGPSI